MGTTGGRNAIQAVTNLSRKSTFPLLKRSLPCPFIAEFLTDDGQFAYQFGRKFVSPTIKAKPEKWITILAGNWHSMALSGSF